MCFFVVNKKQLSDSDRFRLYVILAAKIRVVKRVQLTEEKLKRTNSLTLKLNPREMRALNIYCKRYRVRNRSEFMRRTIMQTIIGRFDSDYPTLWEQGELSFVNSEVKQN